MIRQMLLPNKIRMMDTTKRKTRGNATSFEDGRGIGPASALFGSTSATDALNRFLLAAESEKMQQHRCPKTLQPPSPSGLEVATTTRLWNSLGLAEDNCNANANGPIVIENEPFPVIEWTVSSAESGYDEDDDEDENMMSCSEDEGFDEENYYDAAYERIVRDDAGIFFPRRVGNVPQLPPLPKGCVGGGAGLKRCRSFGKHLSGMAAVSAPTTPAPSLAEGSKKRRRRHSG